MWPFTEFWDARTTFMRRTLLNNSSWWILCFPIFFLMSRVLGEFDDVFWCQFSLITQKRLSRIRILRHVTQFYRLLQYRNWSFCITFLWLLVGLSSCLNMSDMSFVVMYTSFLQTCNSDTREDDRIHMTCFCYRIWMEFRTFSLKSFPLYWLFSLRIFVPLRQSPLSSNDTQEKTIGSSFSSLTFVNVTRGNCLMTEKTWISFGTLFMCHPLKTLSHFLLNESLLSFFTDPLSTTSLRTLKFSSSYHL